MLHSFYGLAEAPFELTANPRYLFLTAHYRETLGNLECGLTWPEAITVLVGPAGTGKSTLLRAALESDRCRQVSCVFVDNPTLTPDEFLETLALRFNLGADAERSKPALLDGLVAVVRDRQARGQVTALVVDEAQAMPDELFDEIRLLANMETPTGKLLAVVLAGQPELKERWNEPGLRQLKQRVALRCELKPLELPETAGYIASRIRTAGGNPGKIFTREAVTLIHEYSHGVPRTISVICRSALTFGFAHDQRRLDCEVVREVCHDFDLRPPAKPLPAAAPLALVDPAAHTSCVEGDDPGAGDR